MDLEATTKVRPFIWTDALNQKLSKVADDFYEVGTKAKEFYDGVNMTYTRIMVDLPSCLK